ncbi:MAG TPA: hypothetical protein VMQ44_02275 [Candidatus Saccharimonadales bacterium]|nr:hypothetical protein [Candidatus Saccharimonadales bacterium]
MSNYTNCQLKNRGALSVAPDTHVIQASVRLGLVAPAVKDRPDAAIQVSRAWEEVLADTGISPIDIHTPLWLWSRGGFKAITTR